MQVDASASTGTIVEGPRAWSGVLGYALWHEEFTPLEHEPQDTVHYCKVAASRLHPWQHLGA